MNILKYILNLNPLNYKPLYIKENMKIKQFIEKAIEGGWEEPYRCSDSFCNTDDAHLFLDPLAWQAVGKVEGWNGQNKGDGRELLRSWKNTWLVNMHSMIDALAEGKSIEEYFEKL